MLYKTGLHHAGEVLAKILSARNTEEKLIVMADASSANTSKIHDKKTYSLPTATVTLLENLMILQSLKMI